MMDPRKTALLVLLISGLVFPAMACVDNATEIIMGPQYGVGGLIGVVIALTVLIIATSYAIGSATNNAHFTVFAKDEMYHLFFSIGILLGMTAIVGMSCYVIDFFNSSTFTALGITSACNNPSYTMQGAASCYATQAQGDAQRIAKIYIQKYIDNLMDSTFSWNLQFPLMSSYTSTADSYKRIVSNQYDMILNQFLIPALLSISMQKIGLDFIKENVVQWFLPTAFLLRIFIPTRQMGNMLIALSLGLYIIVPFLYVFNFAMYDALLSKSGPGSDCQEFKGAVYDFVADGGNGVDTTCDNQEGFWAIARLIPQAFFLPNLTIAIMITFLTAMNKALKVMG